MTALHHRERGVELRAEQPGAPRVPRERGERLEDGDGAAVLAESCLDAPDGDDDLLRHAVLLADPGQELAMLASQLAPVLHHPRRHVAPHVRLERLGPLGLTAIARDHAWPRRQTHERLVEQLVTIAARPRFGQEVGEPGIEGLARLGRTGRRDGEDEREGEEQRHAASVAHCLKEWTLTGTTPAEAP